MPIFLHRKLLRIAWTIKIDLETTYEYIHISMENEANIE